MCMKEVHSKDWRRTMVSSKRVCKHIISSLDFLLSQSITIFESPMIWSFIMPCLQAQQIRVQSVGSLFWSFLWLISSAYLSYSSPIPNIKQFSHIYREVIKNTEYSFKANHPKIVIGTYWFSSKTQLRNAWFDRKYSHPKWGTKILDFLSKSRHYWSWWWRCWNISWHCWSESWCYLSESWVILGQSW